MVEAIAEPFHVGELAVQERAGVRQDADRLAGHVTGKVITPGLAGFLCTVPLVAVASTAETTGPAAMLLAGAPGFISATAPGGLSIHPPHAWPTSLVEHAEDGKWPVGLTVIDLASRRRLKAKGLARQVGGQIQLSISRVYGLCPKYIQARQPHGRILERHERAPTDQLTADMAVLIQHADTAFIATTHRSTGADAAHRGGPRGFLRVLDERLLEWDDYPGNNMFNTFGNLERDSRAGLVVADLDEGRSLELRGTATVVWSQPRRVRFAVAHARLVVGGLAEGWTQVQPSPHNPAPAPGHSDARMRPAGTSA